MRRCLLILVATWMTAAGTAIAAAPPPLQDLGPAVGVQSDGRHVLAEQADGSARVVTAGSAGPGRVVPVPDGCFASGISAEQVLINCYLGGVATGSLYDLRTGARRALPAPPLPSDPLGGYGAIGRRWAEVQESDGHTAWFLYLNLATGHWRRVFPDARSVIDLDSTWLVRPLCAPLRRLPLNRPLAFMAGAIAYRPPFGAGLTNQSPRRLVLWRCHRARPVLLSHCPVRCLTPHLARGVVAWYDERLGPRIRARRLSRGPTYSWSIPGAGDPAVTPGRVWVAAGGRLLTARLP
jgi:hypothetical protein